MLSQFRRPARAGRAVPPASPILVGGYVLSRRRFLVALGASYGAGTATALAGSALARPLGAQAVAQSSVSNVAMDPSGYRKIERPAKPGAIAQLTKEDVDALEHNLGCACPCALDVFTCRTTDFSCGISPDMHRDVLRLVEGGHSGDEIIAAFVDTYGEQVLMAPKRQGFNLAGYFMPFAALGTGGVVLALLIRRWGVRAAEVRAAAAGAGPGRAGSNGASPYALDASADELARLESAVRSEER